MKIAFALGGGGARGLAHIGVIRALTEAGIKPDLIVGTSMGAIVGAMYAQTADIDAVEYKLREYTKTEHYTKLNLKNYNPQQKAHSFLDDAIKRIEERIVINLTVSEIALFKQKKFITALKYLLEEGRIEDTKIKFAAVAGDLITGNKVVMTQGDICQAVLASSSIPAFLPPVEIDGNKLVDGEVVELIPSQSARELGAEFIIGVDVRQGLPPNPEIENALDVFFRATMIRSNNLADYVLKADVAIQPEVKNIHWTEFDKLDELIKAGYTAGKEKVDTIKKALPRRRFWFWKK